MTVRELILELLDFPLHAEVVLEMRTDSSREMASDVDWVVQDRKIYAVIHDYKSADEQSASR